MPDFTNPPRGSGCHPPRRGPAPAARAIEPFWGLPGSREGDREALQKCSGGHHFWPRDTLPAPRKVSQVARDAGGGLEGLYGPRRNLWLARDLRDHAFRRLVKCFTNSPPRDAARSGSATAASPVRGGRRAEDCAGTDRNWEAAPGGCAVSRTMVSWRGHLSVSAVGEPQEPSAHAELANAYGNPRGILTTQLPLSARPPLTAGLYRGTRSGVLGWREGWSHPCPQTLIAVHFRRSAGAS